MRLIVVVKLPLVANDFLEMRNAIELSSLLICHNGKVDKALLYF